MITVSATLVPHGDLKSKTTILCLMSIVNDNTGTFRNRNYKVELYSRKNSRIIRKRRLLGYPANNLPAWRLIAAAFEIVDQKELEVEYSELGSRGLCTTEKS